MANHKVRISTSGDRAELCLYFRRRNSDGVRWLDAVMLVLASAALVTAMVTTTSGGRAPRTPDMDSRDSVRAHSSTPSEARLTVIQVTDVYTLANFPSLKTLIAEKRLENPNTISMLTGDFLAPYLLSSVDGGAGMMNAIAKTPIDYLTWGNHEADIDHRKVCQHVRDFNGVWLNSNMQDHAAMEHQKAFDVVEVPSADGSQLRKVGLVAVLSDDPGLYAQFKAPGAFGGASIECPWATLRKYKVLLEEEEGCDLVLPLQHMYVPDDHRTCSEFDFPVVLSGHDHHRVDEVVEGTRLLKPGLDAIYATVSVPRSTFEPVGIRRTADAHASWLTPHGQPPHAQPMMSTANSTALMPHCTPLQPASGA